MNPDKIELKGLDREQIMQMIRDGEIIVAEPPPEKLARCLICQVEVESVTIDTDRDDGLGVIHPCHHEITPAQFSEMAHAATLR